MTRFTRLEVLNTIVNTGLVPVFYNSDPEVAKKIAWAISTGGCRLLEFTNRGDFAPDVFKELSIYCQRKLPSMILGVGSVLDAPTAALYVAYGANFVVGPNLQPRGSPFLQSAQDFLQPRMRQRHRDRRGRGVRGGDRQGVSR